MCVSPRLSTFTDELTITEIRMITESTIAGKDFSDKLTITQIRNITESYSTGLNFSVMNRLFQMLGT